MGRTRAKRLRGFGNAIVLPLATAFVESVIEVFADAARSLGLYTSEVAAIALEHADVPTIEVAPDPMIVLESTDVPVKEDAA